MKRRLFFSAAAGACALATVMITGCGGVSTPEPTGHVALYLTDAPFPFDMIESTNVVLDSVSVHYDDGEGSSGFTTLDLSSRTVNLLDLQHGVTDSLTTVELPVGTIDQLRLHVSDASVVLIDTRSFDLDIPSGASSGIKVFPETPIEVGDGVTSGLLMDFDVSQSFRSIPSSPSAVGEIEGFRFHPVIRANDLATVGSIGGTVWNDNGTPVGMDNAPLPGAAVVLFQDGTEITTTVTMLDGTYRVIGLAAGSYMVEASAEGFTSHSSLISVMEGQETGGQDFVLSPEG